MVEGIKEQIKILFQKRVVRTIIASLLFLSTILTVGIASWYIYLHITLIPTTQHFLKETLDMRVKEINNFLDKNKENVTTLLSDQIITDAFAKLAVSTNTEQTFMQQLSAFVKTQQEVMDFKNLFLITNKGQIIFSTTPRAQGININDAQYNKTPLFQSFQRSSMTLTYDFSDFLYSSILLEPALYITAPILKNGIIIGVIGYQINQEKLYLLIKQYIGLGKTGEIALALETSPYVLFIGPTRHDPFIAFKKRNLFNTKRMIAIQHAAIGEYGVGATYDYREKKVIAAWDFIPRVDWGIVVKMDVAEVLEPLHKTYSILIFFIVMTLLLLILTEVAFQFPITRAIRNIKNSLFMQSIPLIAKHPIVLLSIIFFVLTAHALYTYEKVKLSMIESSKQNAIDQVTQGVDSIESTLQDIASTADFIADDFKTKRLIPEDIKIRIRRDLLETDGLINVTVAFEPYAYNAETKLYAPCIIRKDGATQELMINDLYDYTTAVDTFKSSWYTKTIEHGAQWFDPQEDPLSKETIIMYTTPFFLHADDKKPSGVVAVSYDLKSIRTIANRINVGKTGYSFITTDNGSLILYPIKQVLQNKKTLLQFAQEKGNEELARIAEKIQEKKPLFSFFNDETINRPYWIYSQPIKINKWTLGTIFSQDEIGLSPHIKRQYLFWIIAYAAILALLIIATVFIIYATITRKGVLFLTCSNGILIPVLILLWYSIQATPDQDKKAIAITDQSSLDKFIDDCSQEALRKYEAAPIVVPCGMFLYTLEQKGPNQITCSGYVWHKYNTAANTDIVRGVRIPQATYFRVTSKVTTKQEEWETVGWKFHATIYQEHDYRTYPLDIQRVSISLQPVDLKHNLLLVPDLSDYKTLNPSTAPGIEKIFRRSGFLIKESFFDIAEIDPRVNFGIKEYGNITNHYQLTYNAVFYTDLITPFILFFLPLLVILISIFSTLIVEERKTDPYTMLGPYTGLFFALVLLHRSLHETAPAEGTLYLEYAFFFTYITIILLVIHTILAHYYIKWDYYQNTITPLFKNIFWPTQFTLWIVTTLLIFY